MTEDHQKRTSRTKDGGGALPDVPSVKDEPLRPKQISAVRERRDAHRGADLPEQGKAPSIELLGIARHFTLMHSTARQC